MKKYLATNKNVLLIILIFSSNIIFSQDFNYRWHEDTGEITSFEKHVFKFKGMYTYDMDFEESSQSFSTKFSLLIEKKDYLNNGRLITMWDGKKSSFKISSCYYKTYRNSTKKYYQFQCENEYGVIIYYNLDLDSKKRWRLWLDINDTERMYFTKY